MAKATLRNTKDAREYRRLAAWSVHRNGFWREDITEALGVSRGAVGQGAVGQGAVGQGAVGQGAVGQDAVGQDAVGRGAVGRGAVGRGISKAKRDGVDALQAKPPRAHPSRLTEGQRA